MDSDDPIAQSRYAPLRRALSAYLLYAQINRYNTSLAIKAQLDPVAVLGSLDPAMLAPVARHLSRFSESAYECRSRTAAVLDIASPGWRVRDLQPAAAPECFVIGGGLSGGGLSAARTSGTEMRAAVASTWLADGPADEFTVAWLAVSPRAALRATIRAMTAHLPEPRPAIGPGGPGSPGGPGGEIASAAAAAVAAVTSAATTPSARAVLWRALERTLRDPTEEDSVRASCLPAALFAKFATDADAGARGPTRTDLQRVALGALPGHLSRTVRQILGMSLRQIIGEGMHVAEVFIGHLVPMTTATKAYDFKMCWSLLLYSNGSTDYDYPEVRREIDESGFAFRLAWCAVAYTSGRAAPGVASQLALGWLERVIESHPDLAAIAVLSAAGSGLAMPPGSELAELAPTSRGEWEALAAKFGLAADDIARLMYSRNDYPFVTGASPVGVIDPAVVRAIAAGLRAAREPRPRLELPPLIV